MRVRLRSAIAEQRGQPPDRDYLVISVDIDARPDWPAAITLIALDDEGFPWMVTGADVEIVELSIPTRWQIAASHGSVIIGPPALARGDFWDQFWDNRGPDDDGRWVEPIYRAEVLRLVEELGTESDRRAFAAMPVWQESDGPASDDVAER